jgi:hypothetical protein
LKRTRGRPQYNREPDVVPVSSSSAGPGVWHVVGRNGACASGDAPELGRAVLHEQAQGILITALGMLAACFPPRWNPKLEPVAASLSHHVGDQMSDGGAA